MTKTELILPAMGEGIIEATLIKWLVSEGESVEKEQPLAEIATDKVDTELPSPERGVIGKLLVKEGDVISVGSVMAVIEQSGNDKEVASTVKSGDGKFITPLVRKIAGEKQISHDELIKIEGSGYNGRISKKDLLDYISRKQSGGEERENLAVSPPDESHDKIINPGRIRELIAKQMVISKKNIPHATSFIDADVTDLVNWREITKEKFLKRENQKFTFTPLFVEAAAKALGDFPEINSTLSEKGIILKKEINIGMAVALDNGNLIVPVIRYANEKSLTGLVKTINDLAGRARTNRLTPTEISGSTFTITNYGTFGSISGIPIINHPEAAILGIGAIKKRPVVLETDKGDVIAVRHMVTLSLSYDHRIIDGSLGGRFLAQIVQYLENRDHGNGIM